MLLEEEVVTEVEAPIDEIGRVLERAANIIKEHGWVRGTLYREGQGYCAIGAIQAATGHCPGSIGAHAQPTYKPAMQRLATLIGALNEKGQTLIGNWNDSKATNKEEVIAALQAAARI